jgi:hypothetical protein
MYLNIDMFIEIINAAHVLLEAQWIAEVPQKCHDIYNDMPVARVVNKYRRLATVCRAGAALCRKLGMSRYWFYSGRGIDNCAPFEYFIPSRQMIYDTPSRSRWMFIWYRGAAGPLESIGHGQIVKITAAKTRHENSVWITWGIYAPSKINDLNNDIEIRSCILSSLNNQHVVRIAADILPREFDDVTLESGKTLKEYIVDDRYSIYPNLKTTDKIMIIGRDNMDSIYAACRKTVSIYFPDL